MIAFDLWWECVPLGIWVATQSGYPLGNWGLYRHAVLGYAHDDIRLACTFRLSIYEGFVIVLPGYGKICPECSEIIDGEGTRPVNPEALLRIPQKRTHYFQRDGNGLEFYEPAGPLYFGMFEARTAQQCYIRAKRVLVTMALAQAIYAAYRDQSVLHIEVYDAGEWVCVPVYVTYMSTEPGAELRLSVDFWRHIPSPILKGALEARAVQSESA